MINPVIILRDQKPKIRMMVEGRLATVMWARKIYDDIYEVSLEFDEKGYQLWFAQMSATEGIIPICCSMYQSLATMAIRHKEEELNSSALNV